MTHCWTGVVFDGNYRSLETERLGGVYRHLTGTGDTRSPSFDEILIEFRDRAIAGWESGRETMIAPYMPGIMLDVFSRFWCS